MTKTASDLSLQTPQKILIVDDSLTVVKSLAKILHQAKFDTIEVTDPAFALQMALRQNPDLVVLDLVMPKISGLELLHEIRANNDLRSVPIIVLTATKEEENLVQALESGADDFITKPFNAPILLARIRTHIRSRLLLLELERANQILLAARQREVERERLTTAIELAGATAHKLNQPLTSIVCYADMLLKKSQPDDEDHKAIKAICDESSRMSMMLRKMAELTEYRSSDYVGDTKILDLDISFITHKTTKPAKE